MDVIHYITAADKAKLYIKDWGTGRPVILILAAFKVPTLIIHGTEDKTLPIDASSRAAAEGIKRSTLVEYDGAPQGLFATHKHRLTKDLIDFLGR